MSFSDMELAQKALSIWEMSCVVWAFLCVSVTPAQEESQYWEVKLCKQWVPPAHVCLVNPFICCLDEKKHNTTQVIWSLQKGRKEGRKRKPGLEYLQVSLKPVRDRSKNLWEKLKQQKLKYFFPQESRTSDLPKNLFLLY